MDTLQPPPANGSHFHERKGCMHLWNGYLDKYCWLLIIGSSLVILIGTTGNSVAYCVLKQKAYRNNVMASALRYLAILDNIILWTVVLRLFSMGAFHHDIALASKKACIFTVFYTLLMTSCDNWLLVQITLTRLIHLKCPYKSHVICSKFNYYVLLVSTHILIAVCHGGAILSTFFQFGDQPLMSCYTMVSEEKAHSVFLSVTNLTINFLMPGFLLLVFNFMIAKELKNLHRREKELHSQTPSQGKYTTSSEVPQSRDSVADQGNTSQNALQFQVVFSTRMKTPQRQNECAHTDDLLRQGASTSVRGAARTNGDLSLIPTELDTAVEQASSESPVPEGNTKVSSKCYSAEKILRIVRKNRHNTKLRELPRTVEAAGNLSQNALWAKHPESADDVSPKLMPNTSSGEAKSLRSANIVKEGTTDGPNKTVQTLSYDDIPQTGYKGSSSATTIKSGPRRSADSRLTVKGRWGNTIERVSIAWSQPVDMDVEYSRSPELYRQQSETGMKGNMHSENNDGAGPRMSAKKLQETLKRDSRIQSLTRLLMMASASFICLNLPYWTFHLVADRWIGQAPEDCARKYVILHIVLLLRYSNHSLNFLFYCATGTRFRQEFVAWLASCRSRR